MVADRPLTQEEWDRRQAAGSWRQLPPYKAPRTKSRPRGHDYVEAALALGARRTDVTPAVNLDDIPPEKLAAPTLGAYRRANGQPDEMCQEARVLLAVELVHEAQRRILIERLDGIMHFLAVGATPDQAMARIERLVAEYHGRGGQLEAVA